MRTNHHEDQENCPKKCIQCQLDNEDGRRSPMGACMMSNVVYRITYGNCKDQGKSCSYIGKTERRLHQRVTEHFRNARNPLGPSHASMSTDEVHLSSEFDCIEELNHSLLGLSKHKLVRIVQLATKYPEAEVITLEDQRVTLTLSKLEGYRIKGNEKGSQWSFIGKVCRPVSKSSRDTFLRLRDCSSLQFLQVFINGLDAYREIKVGDCVKVKGKIDASPGPKQAIEFKVDCIEKNYKRDSCSIPDSLKRNESLDMLALSRLRSTLGLFLRNSLNSRHFVNVDPPILTSISHCEDPNEVFKINQNHYFSNEDVFLTTSAQFHLEHQAVCLCSNVYSLGPVFRADKCVSRHHL
ncbi:hypothetical protein ACOME3_000549 [Neoechinorhynchus agilis]